MPPDQRRVLCAEPSEDIRTLLCVMLGHSGYEVCLRLLPPRLPGAGPDATLRPLLLDDDYSTAPAVETLQAAARAHAETPSSFLDGGAGARPPAGPRGRRVGITSRSPTTSLKSSRPSLHPAPPLRRPRRLQRRRTCLTRTLHRSKFAFPRKLNSPPKVSPALCNSLPEWVACRQQRGASSAPSRTRTWAS